MPDGTSDGELRTILKQTRVIACVGISPRAVRPSYFVGRYLSMRGYRVIPVNPVAAGQSLWGETVVASLNDIPPDTPVDMVDIFRRPEFVPEIVDTAMSRLGDNLKTIWMQIGVRHAEAAEQARRAGLRVVQDRCPKIEYQRLSGELRNAGIVTHILSSRLSVWD